MIQRQPQACQFVVIAQFIGAHDFVISARVGLVLLLVVQVAIERLVLRPKLWCHWRVITRVATVVIHAFAIQHVSGDFLLVRRRLAVLHFLLLFSFVLALIFALIVDVGLF